MRIQRMCDVCRVTDDLPHHVEYLGVVAPFSRHFTCCAGMDCEVCLVVLISESAEPPAAWRGVTP